MQQDESTEYPLIDENSPDVIMALLQDMGLCENDEKIGSISKAGEGNMNVVLRVGLSDRSLIVKQSRPWVAKYPSIAAPDDRIVAELNFYKYVQDSPSVTAALPKILGDDISRRTIVMEDLGAASDYSSLYTSENGLAESSPVFEKAIAWLSQLHQTVVKKTNDSTVGCYELRELNHAHIFTIPMQAGAVDLNSICDGLQSNSDFILGDEQLRTALKTLGDQYLASGEHLLHGDYYPGSWLKTDAGFRVIDPEFCFAGPIEFDLGVLAAHWIFCGAAPDRSTVDLVGRLYDDSSVDLAVVSQFAGVELIRRLIGVAQLPLKAELQQRVSWLKTGRSLVLEG